jgi:putative endopeptidase
MTTNENTAAQEHDLRPGTTSGIDVSALDHDVRPQDDLYRHVNGRWIASHVIPADRASDGGFRRLHDEAEAHVRQIIEELGGRDDLTGEEAQIGALYASFMDTATVEAAGVDPLAQDLALLRSASTQAELTGSLGALQRTGGAGAFGFWVDNDAKDPEKYVVHLYQAGLGLPDESYYREDKYAETREAYLAHVARMLVLSGTVDADASTDAAARVLALETRLAAHHWDVVRDRDSELTYNPTTLAALAVAAPGFDWRAWAVALGAPEGSLDDVVVREPEFFTGFAELWASEPLEDRT